VQAHCADYLVDREEALKDEGYPLDTYSDDDNYSDGGWSESGENWKEDDAEETTEVKDESTAYLDFLNEEV
jgi:hypothetical protein